MHFRLRFPFFSRPYRWSSVTLRSLSRSLPRSRLGPTICFRRIRRSSLLPSRSPRRRSTAWGFRRTWACICPVSSPIERPCSLLTGFRCAGPVVGRLVDSRGPRLVLSLGACAILAGYLSIRAIYDGGLGKHSAFNAVGIYGLIAAEALTGIGSCCALSSSTNSVAKSFQSESVSTMCFPPNHR